MRQEEYEAFIRLVEREMANPTQVPHHRFTQLVSDSKEIVEKLNEYFATGNTSILVDIKRCCELIIKDTETKRRMLCAWEALEDWVLYIKDSNYWSTLPQENIEEQLKNMNAPVELCELFDEFFEQASLRNSQRARDILKQIERIISRGKCLHLY